jgi:rhodanese-related sulfurtransferase
LCTIVAKNCVLLVTKNCVLLVTDYNGQVKPNFGTLKNAINIPISDIENGGFQKLDKNATILVYCSHSHRSSRVSYLLTQNGFKNVINLLGGMSEVKDITIIR